MMLFTQCVPKLELSFFFCSHLTSRTLCHYDFKVLQQPDGFPDCHPIWEPIGYSLMTWPLGTTANITTSGEASRYLGQDFPFCAQVIVHGCRYRESSKRHFKKGIVSLKLHFCKMLSLFCSSQGPFICTRNTNAASLQTPYIRMCINAHEDLWSPNERGFHVDPGLQIWNKFLVQDHIIPTIARNSLEIDICC